MKKMLPSANSSIIVASLIFISTSIIQSASNFILAEQHNESQKLNWVSGIVESIKEGPRNSLVTVTMTNGENFNFSTSNKLLTGILVGSSISAKVIYGWAESIKKLEKPLEIINTISGLNSPQSVSGEISDIKECADSSLMTIRMPNGEDCDISISNNLLQGIKKGDNVTVKIVAGWVETIEKKD